MKVLKKGCYSCQHMEYEDVKHLIETEKETWQPSPELWEQYPDVNFMVVESNGDVLGELCETDEYLKPNADMDIWEMGSAMSGVICTLTKDQMTDWRKMIWRRPDE